MAVPAEAVRTRIASHPAGPRARFLSVGLILIAILCFVESSPRPALSQTAPEGSVPAKLNLLAYVPDELLVRFREGVSEPLAKGVHARVGAHALRHFRSVDGLQVVKLPPGVAVKEAIRAYRQDPDVLYAEPNYIYRAFANPNDPRYAEQWNLQTPVPLTDYLPGGGIDAVRAWDTTTGSSQMVVAVIDSGIDYRHPDLAANMFRNSADCDADGVDDDHNGYVDDCYGIDTFNHDSDPFDDAFHGTAVASVIGAVGNNNVGIVGVNWNVTLMPCKWIGADGFGETSGALECFDYVANMKDRGVNIVATNNSWGGTEYSQALYDAIQHHLMRGILCVAASGNDFISIDNSPRYPASFFLANMIAVASSDSSGGISVYSNYGPRSVHLRAPGDNVLVILPGEYGLGTGTSLAAPHVAGVAALLKAANPSRDWRAIKNLILAGGDPISNADWVITGKKLNAYGSMHCSDSEIYRRLRPFTDPGYSNALETGYAGVPYDLSALHINCDQAAGEIPVRVAETGETFDLTDDGVPPDQAAGDGIYSAGWIPPAGGTFDLRFPYFNDWDNANIPVLDNYYYTSAPFDYRNISGTNLGLAPNGATHIPENFYVGFGGLSFGDIFVGDNGVVSISIPSNASLNQAIPDPGANILIAPFWDDLQPVGISSQNVFYEIRGTDTSRELVIEWRNVRHANCSSDASATVKFQVVLFEYRSEILFNYADTTFGGGCAFADHGGTATVGIQIGPKVGTQYSFETPSLSDNTAILWKLPNASLVNPSSITFFDTRVGTTGDNHTVQISNPSTVPLNILSVTSTGDFSTSYYCPRPIFRGSPCSISVDFLPTVPGPRTGTLTITDDSPQSPHIIPLMGNGYDGVGPVATFSALSVDLGEVLSGTTSSPQTITLTNTGDAGLGITGITSWDQGVFEQDNSCGPIPRQLEPGASCTIEVRFHALGAPRTVTNSLSISHTGDDSHTDVLLQGIIIAPEVKFSPYELVFPDQPAGMASSPQTVTVNNSGSAPMHISGFTISADFLYTSHCGVQLDPGMSCTLEVRFKPTTLSTIWGSLRITGDAWNDYVNLSLRGNAIPAYALSTDTPTKTIVRGTSSATVNIQATSLYGYTGSITLSCSGALACTSDPPSIRPGESAVLTVGGLSAVSSDTLDFLVYGNDGYQSLNTPFKIIFADVVVAASSPSLTVAAGQTASFQITLTPVNGFDHPLSFSCTQLPKESACTFDPSSVSLDGEDPANASVRISTTARSMTLPPPQEPGLPFRGAYYVLLTAAVVLLLGHRGMRRPLRPVLSAAFLLIVLSWIACGGGGGGGGPVTPQRGTPAGTYYVVIHATAVPLDRTANVTFHVN